jgi:hypothetical protein
MMTPVMPPRGCVGPSNLKFGSRAPNVCFSSVATSRGDALSFATE